MKTAENILVGMIVEGKVIAWRYAGDDPRDVCNEIEHDLRQIDSADITFSIRCRYPAHHANILFYLNDLLAEINHDAQIGV